MIMKRTILFFILMLQAATLVISCSYKIEDVDFNVFPDPSNVYETGNSIQFNISGNPDYITFYSGEDGCRYDYAGMVDDEGNANYGISVKSINSRETKFTYTYSTPGKYEAVFVGKNSSFGEEKSEVITLQIEITAPQNP